MSKSSLVVTWLAAFAVLFAPGCAYMFHGTSDEIHIQSGDPKAELYLDDQAVGIASATATVDRDKSYTIEAKEAGCETRTVQTGDKFDPISLLGLFIDVGLISILVVDMGISGAAWKTYPLTYTVNPICPVASAAPTLPPAAAAANSDQPRTISKPPAPAVVNPAQPQAAVRPATAAAPAAQAVTTPPAQPAAPSANSQVGDQWKSTDNPQ